MDAERYRLKVEADPSRAPHHDRTRSEAFLRGPIPMSWIAAAARCPGKGSTVGQELWHQSGMKDHAAVVKLNMSRMYRVYGMARTTTTRGLKALVVAKLAKVLKVEHNGSAADVKILDAPEKMKILTRPKEKK